MAVWQQGFETARSHFLFIRIGNKSQSVRTLLNASYLRSEGLTKTGHGVWLGTPGNRVILCPSLGVNTFSILSSQLNRAWIPFFPFVQVVGDVISMTSESSP